MFETNSCMWLPLLSLCHFIAHTSSCSFGLIVRIFDERSAFHVPPFGIYLVIGRYDSHTQPQGKILRSIYMRDRVVLQTNLLASRNLQRKEPLTRTYFTNHTWFTILLLCILNGSLILFPHFRWSFCDVCFAIFCRSVFFHLK